MTDIVDENTRSRMMSGIRGKNTKPEVALRKALHSKGFRFRLHAPGLPGKPDMVFRKFNAVVFVHGCFWHHHEGCKYATMPATRIDFWADKFRKNQLRDQLAIDALMIKGWRVATIWECTLRKSDDRDMVVALFNDWISSESLEISIGAANGYVAIES